MKNIKILILLFGLILISKGKSIASAPPTREMAITAVGTGTTVSVSTSAWTAVPATSSLTGRQRLIVSNTVTNASYMACTISSSAPSEAITVHNIYIAPGATLDIGVASNLSLYCVYTGAAGANIHVKEVNQ